jgi:hypothetical protein
LDDPLPGSRAFPTFAHLTGAWATEQGRTMRRV